MPAHPTNAGGRHGSLASVYRINERNLALRRQFVGLGPAQVKTLRGLARWAEKVADPMAKDFYDYQFAFAPTRDFFEAFAREHGIPMDAMRKRLEQTQSGYFRDIFREASGAGEFGPTYFERRLVVGRKHNIINLPQKWYMGSYPLYLRLVKRYLRRSYLLRPGLRAKAEEAILAVFSLDQQAVSDAFFYDYLQSIGFDLAAVDVARDDHDLSERYEALKTGVRSTLEEAARTSTLLLDLGEQLRMAADEAGAATREISVAMAQVAAGAGDQAGAATDSSNAVTALSQVISQVQVGAGETRTSIEGASSAVSVLSEAIEVTAGAAREVGEATRSAAEAAGRGAESVTQAREGMLRIRNTVAESSARVSELGAKSEQIGAIVETIDDIAAQTNLLALNAAIEAARAGEMGKGFAVVADEVRKLAERSSRATKEIGGLIAEVQTVTTAAVSAMQAGGQEVEQGVTLAEESANALSDIRIGVERTSVTVAEIVESVTRMERSAQTVVGSMERIETLAVANAQGADEMANHSQDVVAAVESIAAVSEENSAASEQVSASSATMASQMEGVADSAHMLAELATTLGGLMAQFDLGTPETPAPSPGPVPASGEGLQAARGHAPAKRRRAA